MCSFDAVAKALPVVCAFAGDPRLLDMVDTVVRLTQNTETAVAYARLAARIFEALLLRGTATDVPSALTMAIATERDEVEATHTTYSHHQCEARRDACARLQLVSEILALEPPSFEAAMAALGSDNLMHGTTNMVA